MRALKIRCVGGDLAGRRGSKMKCSRRSPMPCPGSARQRPLGPDVGPTRPRRR